MLKKPNSKLQISWILLIHLMSLLACGENQANKTNNSIKVETNKIPNINKINGIENTMIRQGLVNLKSLDSSILVDLKYSSNENFFGEDVYGDFNTAYLQKEVAEAVVTSNMYLMQKHPNLSLIVFDAARPRSIQQTLWNKLDTIPPTKRKDFVADPEVGSIHNYGAAVDLSIYDFEKKDLVDMGTKYDFFGYLAYPRLENKMLKEGKLTLEQVKNRELLRETMKMSGFMPITSEWWHFNFYSRNQAKSKFKIIE